MPILTSDKRVTYAGAKEFQDSYKSFLSQGAILVTPQQKLAAFEKLELSLVVPGFDTVTFKAEVTSFMGEDALLRIVPFDADLRIRLSQASNAASDRPAAPTTPPPEAAPVAAAPPAAAPVDAAPVDAAPVATPPVAAAPVAAPPIAAPPVAAAPTAPLQAPAAAAPVPFRSSPTQASPRPVILLKPSGSFANPKLPRDFLNLPLARPPSEAEVATPATIIALMSLCTRRSEIVALRVKGKSGRDQEVVVARGDFVASAMPLDGAVKTLAELEGTYEIRVLEAEPKLRNRYVAQAFGFALLKEYTKRYIDTEYADAMSGRQGQAPRMAGRGELLARSVGLSEVQLRIATRMLTGQYVLDEVLNNGVGARSTWQMLFLLQVLGGLEWTEAPPRQNILVDEMQTTLARIKTQDHFTAMGLHLSSSPITIEKTYQRLRAQFGPGSRAHQLSPPIAEAIWSHLERCYEVISTPAGRKAYRATAFPNVRLDYAAQLVYDQARLAAMRREYDFALDQMNAVLELHPTREFLEEFRRMQVAAKEDAA